TQHRLTPAARRRARRYGRLGGAVAAARPLPGGMDPVGGGAGGGGGAGARGGGGGAARPPGAPAGPAADAVGPPGRRRVGAGHPPRRPGPEGGAVVGRPGHGPRGGARRRGRPLLPPRGAVT